MKQTIFLLSEAERTQLDRRAKDDDLKRSQVLRRLVGFYIKHGLPERPTHTVTSSSAA